MVSSQARRDQVALAMERGHSQRQACELMELPRSILKYRAVRAECDAPALDAMRRIAATYPRYGYRRVRIFLGREGHAISGLWRRAWEHVIPFFAFPPDVRRIIYTTNAIESVHMRLRKIIKTRGHFPTDEAATKLIWLALRNITADWTRPTRQWKAAMNQFAILYADRFKPSAA